MTQKAFILLLFILLSAKAFSQDNHSYCSAFNMDTMEYVEVQKYIEVLDELDSKYLNLVYSLSDNMNIMHFEKMNYFLNLDKFLKFRLAKELYKYEDKKLQEENAARFTELKQLNDVLHVKIIKLENRIQFCLADTNIRQYVENRNLIEDLDPHYFNKYINLVNLTIDNSKINYEEIKKLEMEMLTKLVDSRNFLANKVAEKNSEKLSLKITKYDELIAQFRVKIDEIAIKQGMQVKENIVQVEILNKPETYQVKHVITDYRKYFITQNINIEEVIIINNEIFISRNDSLIKIINKDLDANPESIHSLVSQPISVDDYEGLFYTIQIGTYAAEKSFKDLNVQSNLFYKILPNGNYRYSFGMFRSPKQAGKLLDLLRKLGIKETVIIAYNEGERISIREANALSKDLE